MGVVLSACPWRVRRIDTCGPVAQQGRRTASLDEFWQTLIRRHGRQDGTRAMVEVLRFGKQHGYNCLGESFEDNVPGGIFRC